MQTIETKYYGATTHKGARIKAWTSGGFVKWFSYNHELNAANNHCAAAKAIKDELEWRGKMHGGHTKNGMVFVWDNDYSIE